MDNALLYKTVSLMESIRNRHHIGICMKL